MTDNKPQNAPEGSGASAQPDLTELMGGVDPGSTDLGDDVYRDDVNRGTTLPESHNQMTGGIDAGNADLGSDVYRDAAEPR